METVWVTMKDDCFGEEHHDDGSKGRLLPYKKDQKYCVSKALSEEFESMGVIEKEIIPTDPKKNKMVKNKWEDKSLKDDE